jgi:hypothetical protein
LKNFETLRDDVMGSLEQICWSDRSLGVLASATKDRVKLRFRFRRVSGLQHRCVPKYPLSASSQ